MDLMDVGKHIQETATSLHLTAKNGTFGWYCHWYVICEWYVLSHQGYAYASFEPQKQCVWPEIEVLCDIELPRWIALLHVGGGTTEERTLFQVLADFFL